MEHKESLTALPAAAASSPLVRMRVADNMFLGRTVTTRGGFVRDRLQVATARGLLQQFGLRVDVEQNVEELPLASQQLVEIAKALGQQAKVIVMDEPTSALAAPEVEKLFGLIGQLKASGCGIVYITHKMEEIEQIADRITVLRDGRLIGSATASDLSSTELIRWMVGREVDQQFPRRAPRGEQRLRVDDFCVTRGVRRIVDNVSLSVRAGEIVGLAGLQGSGNSPLLMGLFGAHGTQATGRIWLDGRPLVPGSVRRSIRRGMALPTNDRKANGLVLSLSVVANTTLADLARFSPRGWRSDRRERAAALQMAQSLNLRAASLEMEVAELSGGSQQKVALAKWLQTQPRVLLLDEPTRGVDVGAKREISELINEWTRQGMAILLVSSEMPELLAISDRILVMHRGRLTAELSGEQASADKVLEAAMGNRIEGATA